MLADIVCALWLVMSLVLGWKRKFKLEAPTFVILTISYILARIASIYLAHIVDGVMKKGPLTGAAVATLLLWPVLYYTLQYVWKQLRSKLPAGEAGIRISVDADGNPLINRSSLLGKSIGGAIVGLGRGIILYAGVLYILLLIIPSTMYKDGRGTVIVHPKSVTLKLLRQLDPILLRMEQVTRGLQTIRGIQTRVKIRRKYRKSKQAQALYRSPEIKRIRKKRKLLRRANSKRQGRRDSTLLLWLKSYQHAVFDTKTATALHKLQTLMK